MKLYSLRNIFLNSNFVIENVSYSYKLFFLNTAFLLHYFNIFMSPDFGFMNSSFSKYFFQIVGILARSNDFLKEGI